MSESTIASLEKEVDSLKKKLGVATIVGLVIGSGGLLGTIKWVPSDRQFVAAQTVETKVLKLDTLADIYEQEKEKIEAEKSGLNLEQLE